MTARLLFVHAHPDDETIVTGGVMARYAAEGAEVTLVTCTRGELGEVIPPDLADLAADPTERERAASGRNGDELARHREAELAEAMSVLKVRDHRLLGDVDASSPLPWRRFRDSGMVWGSSGHAEAPAEMHAEAFCRAEVDEAARYLEAIVREIRPHVLVSYNAGGGYGHPDHVRAREVAMAAVARAARPDATGAAWDVPKVYQIDTPESAAREQFDPAQPGFAETGFEAADRLPLIPVPDDEVTTAVDVQPWLGQKALALSKHATQVQVAGEFMALSNRIGFRIADIEYFTLIAGERTGELDEQGREASLVDGLAPEPAGASPSRAGAPANAFADGGASSRQARARRSQGWLGYAVAVVLGLLIGAFGTIAHQLAFSAAGTQWPVGLAITGLLVVCAHLWIGLWTKNSGAMLVLSLVVILVVWFFAFAPSPGGSVLIPGNARGVAWLFLPILITAVMIFVVPRLIRRALADSAADPDDETIFAAS